MLSKGDKGTSRVNKLIMQVHKFWYILLGVNYSSVNFISVLRMNFKYYECSTIFLSSTSVISFIIQEDIKLLRILIGAFSDLIST